MCPPLLNKRIFNNKPISPHLPKILPQDLGLFFRGLGEGASGELMLMEMLVVDGAGTDVWEIPGPEVCGEEAASGFLEGVPGFSVEPTVL